METAAHVQDGNCKGCRASVRIPQKEIDRIISEHFAGADVELADAATYSLRMAVCRICEDLVYGTTCRHCGCLVAVRAKIAGKECPAHSGKWAKCPDVFRG